MKRLAIFVPILVLACAETASAQFFLNPFIGTTLSSPSPDADSSEMGYGIAFGNLGKIAGFETEFAYFPEILGSGGVGVPKTKTLTFDADTLIGPTIKSTKIYGAFGFGSMTLDVSNLASAVIPGSQASVTNTYFAFNVGGGVAASFGHFGVKGDLRYFKAYGVDFQDFTGTTLQIDNFNFWRGTIGLLVTF